MKLYNPFKPHIVQFDNGKFALRRWDILTWEYKDRSALNTGEIYWWSMMLYVKKWCMVDTLEEAKVLLDKNKYQPIKVVKIHNET